MYNIRGIQICRKKDAKKDNMEIWKKISDAITAVISANVGPFLGGTNLQFLC